MPKWYPVSDYNSEMEIHTYLRSDIEAFDFRPEDFEPLREALPKAHLYHHDDPDSLARGLGSASIVLTWEFAADWYHRAPALKGVLTPAAGADWVRPDPAGDVPLIHGTFHGDILRESLLHAMLFMNHNMPAMIRNFEARQWDRNLQADSRLLAGQRALIIGYGHIGRRCGDLLTRVGMHVTGIGRTPKEGALGIDDLVKELPLADHIILLLPGERSTDGLIGSVELAQCKPGAFIYNFGRGNALPTTALLAHLDHLGGAFLDVVDQEPLPPDSPLWSQPNVMITPHSSCVYRDYKPRFLQEVASRIRQTKE